MSENAHIIYTFSIQLKHTGTGDDGIAIYDIMYWAVQKNETNWGAECSVSCIQ